MNGTCMFSFECIKGRGQPIGVCVSGYFVRSCCKLPPKPILTTTTTTTTTSTSTSPPPVTRSSSASAVFVTKQVTKASSVESNSERLNKQPTTPSLLPTTASKVLSTRLASIGNEFSFSSSAAPSSSTQRPKINSEPQTDPQTTTSRPTPAKLALDQSTTNSPTLIETTNEIADMAPDSNSSSSVGNLISNEFNEKIVNQPSSSAASLLTNFTNEFTSLNSSLIGSQIFGNPISPPATSLAGLSVDGASPGSPVQSALAASNASGNKTQISSANSLPTQSTANSLTNKATTQSALNLDTPDSNNQTSLEKKNAPAQLENGGGSPSTAKSTLANNSATSRSTPIASTTTALPTTLKYVDLLRPLNKTANSSLPELTTERSQATEASVSPTANNTSHRIAIVYNPTTTTSTTVLPPIAPNESSTINSNQTSSAGIETPVNIKAICGKRLNMPKGRIVGGTKSYFGEYPWMVSLRQWKKNAFLHKCGAALLNEYWAITAAHCVEK